MANKGTQPIGIELVKKGIVKEEDINKALDYQKDHPSKRIGDILYELHIGNPSALIGAIADILGEKPMLLSVADIRINIADYLPLDIARKNKAIPFEAGSGKIKVCFSNTANQRMLENMRLLFLNKGYIRKRNKELAVLYALGRSKKDVIIIILLEHLLISTIAFIVGYFSLWMIRILYLRYVSTFNFLSLMFNEKVVLYIYLYIILMTFISVIFSIHGINRKKLNEYLK